ncbi:glycosyltransferase family 2 protein [Konateibacter massiliensis]|uniref:glycosyltransferase family 2 protein n=1 Tax=Konateibacter massiliensis TaxID=2002841 RepID=UPI000C1535D3|nr:glycosyltransferase family 2 protein [Konateibacter massiliensis]
MKRQEILYVVIPCYNEKEVLHETTKRLSEKMNTLIDNEIISVESKILYVNDGSKDNTWEIIEKLYERNPLIQGLNLARNRGHQNALLAGLMTAKEHADMVISMDADLQDDINVVDEFVKKYYEGNDIVYGVRSARKTDTFFKKFTAQGFYKLMLMMGVDLVYNHADYRLMSKRSLENLEEFKEVNLFLRGIVPQIGYKSAIVEYERNERFAGESKYPLKKMLAFAMDGITSFSIKPIRLITTVGVLIFLASFLMGVWSIVQHFRGATIAGWTSMMVSIWAIGGLQILAIGIVGEYIGKIYMEAKGRPRYIIEKYLK